MACPRNPVPQSLPGRVLTCPGDPGCRSAEPGALRAGFARRSVLPRGFEVPNAVYLVTADCDPEQVARTGAPRCGMFPTVLNDCGADGLCPGGAGYTGADADGSERDGREDFFRDCGRDRLCPGNVPETGPGAADGVDNDGDGAVDGDDVPYAEPDADGSEGNGVFEGAWIAGFGNNRPALGAHDAVDARCVSLSAADTRVVLCALDAVGLFFTEAERARALLAQRHPEAGVDHLVIASTHTHESVDTLGQWGRADPAPVSTGRMEGHNAFLVDQVVDAAAEAALAEVPVALHARSARTGVAGFLHDGRVPLIYDDTMTLLEARPAAGGACVFTLVHWSNHPEILGGENNLISADFVAPLRDAVERGLPAAGAFPAHAGRGCPAVYFTGTVGGLMAPLHVVFTARDGTRRPDRPRSFQRMQDYADNLAEVALSTWEGSSAEDAATQSVLQVGVERIAIPAENALLLTGFRLGLFDRTAYDLQTGAVLTDRQVLTGHPLAVQTEVAVIRVGPIAFAAVPGELFPETAVGGADGAWSPDGRVVPEDHCPPQDTCASAGALPCPVHRPPGGWPDCQCEACRTCAAPDLSFAPPGPTLKARLGTRHPVVLGLANDELGYLVPAWQWQVSERAPYTCEAWDHYEETNALGPLAGPRVEEALDRLLR